MAYLVSCEVYLSNRDKFFAGLPTPLNGFTSFSKSAAKYFGNF